MKLSTRTFLFMTGLVLFQAILAFNFLSLSLTRISQNDGASTLRNEKEIIHNHFLRFHNLVWMDIIHIENIKLLQGRSIEDAQQLFPLLVNEVHTKNLDYMTLTQGEKIEGLNLRNPYGKLLLSRLPSTQGKWHPGVEILEKDGTLFISGILRVVAEENNAPPLLLHLYKELNNDFCRELAFDTGSAIILIQNNKAVSGTMDPQYYISGIRELRKKSPDKLGERLIYDQFFYNKSYNILITPLEHMKDRSKTVDAVIFSPNLSLKQRMAAIQQQFLLISILGVMLALIISLGISKSISRPVQELCHAMGIIRNGSFPQVDSRKRSTEIVQLYSGFNTMAESLREDAVKQQKYIREITFLKDYNEQIMDSIQEGIAVIDQLNHLTKMNSAFHRFYSCNKEGNYNPKVDDLPFWDIFLQKKLDKIRSGELNQYHRVNRTIQGKSYDIRLYQLHQEGSDKTIHSCILMLDNITSRVEMESRMLQTEKLNSITILTAGVAHEINNPLGAIMLNVENLENEIKSDEGIQSLKWIKNETRRIASIVQNLFRFTGKNENSRESSNQNSWIPQLDHYMKYLLKEYPRVIFSRTEDLPELKCVMPPDELLQTLINLLNNAVQAIEGEGSTHLEIQDEKREGISHLVITVSDTGPGISQTDQMRIFDPFYTTKPVGKGTGLGLSIVYGLIMRYHGSISVQSESSQGTTFTLALPRE